MVPPQRGTESLARNEQSGLSPIPTSTGIAIMLSRPPITVRHDSYGADWNRITHLMTEDIRGKAGNVFRFRLK
jgi:hypothetical protein